MAMKNAQLRKGTSSLRPRANIIRLIGDELISSDTVAVTELVKNAYDADATEVTVRFSGDMEKQHEQIEVIDNGTGMSIDTVRSAWLEPATSAKKTTRITSRGRRILGEKGIGRFAAARLGTELEMITKQPKSDTEISVLFDWGAFDGESYLDEIECTWEERPAALIKSHGTILRISGLGDKWFAEDFKELRNSLSRIISPFDAIKEFKVVLDLPAEFKDLSESIAPSRLLSHPHYTIKGKVSKTGQYELEYTGRSGRAEPVKGVFGKPRARESGPFEVELRIWDRDPPGIQELTDAFRIEPSEVREDLNSNSGVYIYRDDFRVLPYGEPNNDWLRLDLRRVQNPTMRVSNNQVVGCILVSADRNSELRDQTNREGIVASRAFEDLKTLVKEVLSQAEQRRYRERRPAKSAQGARGGIFSNFNLSLVRSAVLEKYPADQQLLEVVHEQEKDLSQRVVAVQDVLARYRRLATMGKLVDIFLHEGRTPLNKISSEAELGIESLESLEGHSPAVSRLRKKLKFILGQTSLLSSLLKKMEPFGGRKRGRPARVILESIIADAFDSPLRCHQETRCWAKAS